MEQRFAPVPVLKSELLTEVQLEGIRVTEAWHRASSTIDRHAHRQATITFLLDGSFEEGYAYRRDLSCQAPAMHVRPPGEPHLDRLGVAGAHNLVLEVEEATVAAMRRYSTLFDEVRHLRNVELLEISRRLFRELQIRDDFTPLALEGLSMEVLATATRATHRPALKAAPWLLQVRDFLHDSFRESGLTLAGIAAVAGVHRVHLARAFRETFGVSPGEYLRRLRVDWAARELSTGDRSLAEIASEAGFADQSHFTRVFRRIYGAPPGAWRRAWQAEEKVSPPPPPSCIRR